MRLLTVWIALLGLLLGGCPPDSVSDDDASDDDTTETPADDDASDDDASDDDTSTPDDDASDDDTGDDDACSDYRTQYPAGPYGFNVNSVLEDFPDMVDGQGNPHDLGEIYADTSKVALVIANAFDT